MQLLRLIASLNSSEIPLSGPEPSDLFLWKLMVIPD